MMMWSDQRTHWEGAQNRRPPGSCVLRVRGNPSMPTPLHVPMLRRAEVQGPDPRVLYLELTAIAPVFPAPHIVTQLPVSYEERGTQPYDRIRVRSLMGTEPDASIEILVLQLEVVRGGAGGGPRPARSA